MNFRAILIVTVLTAALLVLAGCQGDAQMGPTVVESRLETVRERGVLNCVSHIDFPGFGYRNADGAYRGFDIDLCRAVAAATLGDPDAITVLPRTFAQRAEAIESGDTDVLSMTTTWTSGRSALWGNFTAIMFYNGQSFMVRKKDGYDSALDMDGAKVCVTGSTTTEKNLEEYFKENELRLEVAVFEDRRDAYTSYANGDCDAVTDDVSALQGVRHTLGNPDEHALLPEIISKEPLSPLAPHGDEQWTDIVTTVMHVLINAEELGVTQANVESMVAGGNAEVRRMLGAGDDFGQSALGLEADFAVNVIKGVGNYGEIYDRYMGPDGESFPMPRGLNRLWTDGGLIYSPPLR